MKHCKLIGLGSCNFINYIECEIEFILIHKVNLDGSAVFILLNGYPLAVNAVCFCFSETLGRYGSFCLLCGEFGNRLT